MKTLKYLAPALFTLLLAMSTGIFQSALAAEPAAQININTASAEEIAAALNGIGLAKAQAIVAWRDQHGKFTDASQLTEIKGIGESTLAKNSALIVLQ
ncbi:helix-hairpin-helix domain-containing protein [Pseudomaricurvus sp. HS19]|uniref:ComEA family DNA-binding protein n=1 Tax=Pseudomaricurvus sp. HS19 TaxID=2692626 RepID=UPI00136F6E68|nr:helix-hairpin-helix domain-containing protein [Pseudomaricurvus sp. HS19]MYM62884.1 hypothetical protein [Pseudomaricurvus sp. HS19]